MAAVAAAWVRRSGSLLHSSLRPPAPFLPRRPLVQPLSSSSSSSSSATEPQAETNTWCRPADPDMAKWAAPIVKDVRKDASLPPSLLSDLLPSLTNTTVDFRALSLSGERSPRIREIRARRCL